MISKDKILFDIKKAYGSFENPNYRFVEKRYRNQPFKKIELALLKNFSVRDMTDLNEDVSCVWILDRDSTSWALQLSFVGSYGYLAKLDNNEEYVCTISAERLDSSEDEKSIIRIIEDSGLKLLDQGLLEKLVSWKNDEGEFEEVELFRVIFSDIESLPWR